MFLSVIVSVLNWNFTVCKDTILSVLMHMYSPGRVLLSLCVGRVDVTASKDVTAKRTGGQQDSWTMKEGNRVHSSIFGFSTYFNLFRTDKYFDFHHLCLLELYIFKKKITIKPVWAQTGLMLHINWLCHPSCRPWDSAQLLQVCILLTSIRKNVERYSSPGLVPSVCPQVWNQEKEGWDLLLPPFKIC